MKFRLTVIWITLAAAVAAASGQTGKEISKPEQEVRKLERAWLDAYETKDDRLRWRARYERHMAPRGQRLQPTIAHVDVDIDLFPEEQRLVASGTYTLVNDADSAIPVIIVTLLPGTRARDLRVSTASTPGYTHAQFGWYELELAEPLAPGAQIELAFEVERGSDGFVNGEPQHALTHNGSFVHNRVLPAIGYRANLEIEDPEDRMHFNLPPRASRGEANGASPARNAFSPDAHWMTLRTTVSTSADQVALAPGDLEREWESGGRRYFEYVMERPFTHFYAVVSGRWRVLRDEHQGVALEIHYHPGHEHNLERMMRAMKDTLDYGTAAFGPFPHRLLRIAEVPRYHRLAQSFPTLIPFGEAFGFLAGGMARGARYVDYPYYVTAHEVAHQWWGNQLLPAAGPGAQMLSESLAEYTALMVMKKALGTAPVQRFLRHELEQYLDQRKDDASTEAPLAEVTGQRFVYYAKASLAMYALQHYIGENAVNDAARALLERYRYQGPPYATASEFVELVRQRAPDELRYIVRDLLETTTSFRNRAKRATYSRRDDGRYVLELEVEAQKHRLMTGVTGTAGNLPVDLADLIEIGVVDEQGAPVAIEKRWIRESPATFELVLDAPPARAGIDPLHVLIDADPDDNVIAATAAARETLQASP